MVQNQNVDVRGVRFKRVNHDFLAVKAGHQPHTKLVLLLFTCLVIVFCSILPSFAGQILVSLLTKPTFRSELETFISFVEILLYAATLVLTVTLGSNLQFIGCFVAFVSGVMIVGYFIPQDSLTGDIIAFDLCLVSAWIGTISIAILRTISAIFLKALGSLISTVTAIASISFYLKQSLPTTTSALSY